MAYSVIQVQNIHSGTRICSSTRSQFCSRSCSNSSATNKQQSKQSNKVNNQTKNEILMTGKNTTECLKNNFLAIIFLLIISLLWIFSFILGEKKERKKTKANPGWRRNYGKDLIFPMQLRSAVRSAITHNAVVPRAKLYLVTTSRHRH